MMLHESQRTQVWVERHGGSEVVVKAPSERPVLRDRIEHYERALAAAEVAEGLTPPALLEFRSGVPHLVTVRLGGSTLAERLADGPLVERIRLVAQTSELVSRLHQLGLVHGDLDASDCRIGTDGAIFLLDLESVRSIDAAALDGRSTLGDAIPDTRDDVRALGVMLQTALAGVSVDVDPPGLMGVIAEAAVATGDADRYQSAGALGLDLQRCANSLAVTGTISSFALSIGRTSPVLDFDEELFGREVEAGRLAAAYDSCGRGIGEVALVSGRPGAGKSALAARFAADSRSRGAAVGHGKFEATVVDGYGPLADAVSGVVRSVLGSSTHEFERWVDDLRVELGANVDALVDLVPDLATVFPEPLSREAVSGAEARNRMHLALVGLLRSVAAIRPVVLVLDDLQWADADAVRAIAEIVELVGRNFVLVGTHRNDEFDVASLGRDASAIVRIDLAGLDPTDVRRLLVHTLGDAANLGEVTSIVHERTAGNPLFVQELLRRAENADVVRYDPVSGVWLWDVTGLSDLELSENVVDLLVGSFDQLAEHHADILSDAACVGGRFTLADAVAASGRSGGEVADALWSALQLRLIEPVTNEQRRMRVVDSHSLHRFTHDRVAEAAVSRLDGRRRQEAHLRYGRHLAERPDHPIFDVAHHLNEGLLLVSDPEERARLIDINRAAGDEMMAQASFPSAQRYFEAAIELLDPTVWQQQTSEAARLHLGAAEASLLVGDLGRSHEWLDTANPHLEATDALAIRLATLRVRTLVAEQRLNDAIDTAVAALVELGYRLKAEPNQLQAGSVLLGTRRRLRSLELGQLISRPPCTSPEVLATQELIAEATNVSYIVRPNLFPALVRTSLDLTLDNGLMPTSAVGFAHLGVLLAAGLDDHEGAHRWGTFARELADTEHCAASRGSVTWLYFNFIHHWVEPIDGTAGALAASYRDSVSVGDLEAASWAAVVGTYFSFAQGLPLAEVDLLAGQFTPTIRSNVVQTNLCQSTQQMALNLMGRSEEPFLLAGESGYDERVALPAATAEDDTVSIAAAAITKLGLHFWFGDDEGALLLLPEVEAHLDGMAGTLNVPSFHLMNALCRLAVEPEAKATKKAVARAKKKLTKWADGCPANYAPLAALVDGAALASRGELVKAEVAFDRAVSSADDARLSHYAALARERLADVYEHSERRTLARAVRSEAHELWMSIGMQARIEAMESAHPWLAGADGGESVEPAEVERLLVASKEISSEMRLDDLVVRLVDHACELTGAGGGSIHLVTPDGLVPRAQRSGDVTVIVERAAPIGVGDALLRYVERTARPLRLDDVALSSLAPPGVQRAVIASTLTIPISHRSQVVAVLHVEHERAGVFTGEHQQTLSMLGAQAAVSLENVELVGRLEHALDSQEMLTTAQSRFIPTEILRIFEAEDIRSVKVGDTVERNMTVLLSDIRGYSRLVEQLSLDEAGRVALDFLQVAEPAIIGNDGFVQDMRGDEILALFGGRADDGVAAALAMQRAQVALNDRRIADGLPELHAGVGITTGDVMMTMVGGLNRMTCGVIGDAVNLASRIEGLNKRYDTGLLVGDATVAALDEPDHLHLRRMERVQVVNRSEPVIVYEVYDNDPEELRDRKRAAQPEFDAAFELFDAGELVAALRAFEACAEHIPGDVVAALHIDACRRGTTAAGLDPRISVLSEK